MVATPMTQDELDSMKRLLELEREMTRQRLRTAAAEAWVDDYQQKVGINRAVYAAGYGIAPQVQTTTKTETVNTTAQQPVTQPQAQAQPSTWSKAWPILLAAAGLAAGAGIPALLSKPQAWATAPAPAVEMPRYDVEKWVRKP
jgi:hypothetical protein